MDCDGKQAAVAAPLPSDDAAVAVAANDALATVAAQTNRDRMTAATHCKEDAATVTAQTNRGHTTASTHCKEDAAPGSEAATNTTTGGPGCDAAEGVDEGSIKMYFVVNADLGMGRGKVAGQVGHAAAAWTRRLERVPTAAYKKWLAHHEPKIVVKANTRLMQEFCDTFPLQTIPIHDLGRTQIAPNSLTVVAFAPAPSSQLPPQLKTLKLL